MTKKTKLSLLILAILTLSTTHLLRADDDDDDEHEEHGRKGKHSMNLTRASTASNDLRRFQAVGQPQWSKECGSCHLAFHPGFLPARSWKKMMGDLKNHFGEDASLDPKATQTITDFLVAHSSDQGETKRSARIGQSIPASEAPLRITETTYFKRKHHELAASIYKRKSIGSPANCKACHTTADQGDYEEERVKIPKN